MNPSPSPCTRLVNIPYLNVDCNEVAYEYFANVSFVKAYKVLTKEHAYKMKSNTTLVQFIEAFIKIPVYGITTV